MCSIPLNQYRWSNKANWNGCWGGNYYKLYCSAQALMRICCYCSRIRKSSSIRKELYLIWLKDLKRLLIKALFSTLRPDTVDVWRFKGESQKWQRMVLIPFGKEFRSNARACSCGAFVLKCFFKNPLCWALIVDSGHRGVLANVAPRSQGHAGRLSQRHTWTHGVHTCCL